MSHTYLTLIVTLLTGVLSIQTVVSANSPDVKPPNIILVVADDLGFGDVGFNGQKQIKTPSLDEMAADGMVFTQHYSGSTVCMPSRATLMTGKHTGHASVRGNPAWGFSDNVACSSGSRAWIETFGAL